MSENLQALEELQTRAQAELAAAGTVEARMSKVEDVLVELTESHLRLDRKLDRLSDEVDQVTKAVRLTNEAVKQTNEAVRQTNDSVRFLAFLMTPKDDGNDSERADGE